MVSVVVSWWCRCLSVSGFHTERERDTVFAVCWSYLGGVLLVVSRQSVVSQWRFSVVMLTIMNADDDDDDDDEDDDDFEEEDDCADGDVMVMGLVVLMMTMMLLLLLLMMKC